MGHDNQTGFPWDHKPKAPTKRRAKKKSRKRTKDGRLEKGRAARDKAMARVERGAGESWNEHAFKVLKEVARQLPELTSDDLWDAGLAPPAEKRAIGPVFTRGGNAKLIEATNRFRPCRSPSRHAAPVRIWRSLIFHPRN
jgi:hypothetical protein